MDMADTNIGDEEEEDRNRDGWTVMDCVNRDMIAIGTTQDEVHGRTAVGELSLFRSDPTMRVP